MGEAISMGELRLTPRTLLLLPPTPPADIPLPPMLLPPAPPLLLPPPLLPPPLPLPSLAPT